MINTGFFVIRLRVILCACVILAMTTTFWTACVKLDRRTPEKRCFNLEAVRPMQSGPALSPAILEVQRLQISPRFSGRELVYKTGESLFESDFYNVFFIPPVGMLTQDLREWLERSRLFSNVVDPSSLVRADFTLEGVVNALYGDFVADPAAAVVEMQFFLVETSSPDRAILFSGSYARQIRLEKTSARALIKGLNQAVKEIFMELEADLREKLDGFLRAQQT